MEPTCDICNSKLTDTNESVQYPGVCMECIEKEPLIVLDEDIFIPLKT